MTRFIVVFVTAASLSQAKKISGALIKNKIAACVNIIKGIESVFFWEGKVNSQKEVLLIIKTERSRFDLLKKVIKSLHSYSVPEIISLSIVSGDKKYLRWISESVR